MGRKLQWLALLSLFLGLRSGHAQETAQPGGATPVVSIAVFGGDKGQIRNWTPAFGQAISAMLSETLENADKKFQIAEAAEAGDAQGGGQADESSSTGGGEKSGKRAAAGSSQSAAGDSAGAQASEPKTGGSPDCDFMLCGNVTEFGTQTNSSKIGDFISSSPFGNLGGKFVTARVRIDWRLEDARTKKVITRGTAVSTAHGSEFDMAGVTAVAEKSATNALSGGNASGGQSKKKNGMASFFNGFDKAWNSSSSGTGDGSGGDESRAENSSSKSSPKTGGGDSADEVAIIGYDNSAFMESALGKATDEAVKRVVQEVTAFKLPNPDRVAKIKQTAGKVLAVAGKDAIIVSLGSNEGLKEGDKLNLYETVDIKDDKGNVVFTDEKVVGEITLSEVQEDRSRASAADDLDVKTGWTVKAK